MLYAAADMLLPSLPPLLLVAATPIARPGA
jgi:hypothetical protein